MSSWDMGKDKYVMFYRIFCFSFVSAVIWAVIFLGIRSLPVCVKDNFSWIIGEDGGSLSGFFVILQTIFIGGALLAAYYAYKTQCRQLDEMKRQVQMSEYPIIDAMFWKIKEQWEKCRDQVDLSDCISRVRRDDQKQEGKSFKYWFERCSFDWVECICEYYYYVSCFIYVDRDVPDDCAYFAVDDEKANKMKDFFKEKFGIGIGGTAVELNHLLHEFWNVARYYYPSAVILFSMIGRIKDSNLQDVDKKYYYNIIKNTMLENESWCLYYFSDIYEDDLFVGLRDFCIANSLMEEFPDYIGKVFREKDVRKVLGMRSSV